MAAANTPAYYNTAKNIAFKRFIEQAPRWSPTKTLYEHVWYSIFFNNVFTTMASGSSISVFGCDGSP
jgi:hypothetical protein